MTRESLWNQKPSCLSLQVGEKVLVEMFTGKRDIELCLLQNYGGGCKGGVCLVAYESSTVPDVHRCISKRPCPAYGFSSLSLMLLSLFDSVLLAGDWRHWNKRAVKYYSAPTKMTPVVTCISNVLHDVYRPNAPQELMQMEPHDSMWQILNPLIIIDINKSTDVYCGLIHIKYLLLLWIWIFWLGRSPCLSWRGSGSDGALSDPGDAPEEIPVHLAWGHRKTWSNSCFWNDPDPKTFSYEGWSQKNRGDYIVIWTTEK